MATKAQKNCTITFSCQLRRTLTSLLYTSTKPLPVHNNTLSSRIYTPLILIRSRRLYSVIEKLSHLTLIDSKIFVLCYVIADAQLQRFQDRLAQITEVSCGFINNSFLNSTYLIHQYVTVLVRLCARCAQQYKPETDASHNGLS